MAALPCEGTAPPGCWTGPAGLSCANWLQGQSPEQGCPDSISGICCWEMLVSACCGGKKHKLNVWRFPSLLEQLEATAAHLGQACN